MNTNNIISGIAAEDLSGKEWLGVKLTASGLAIAGAADRVIGIIVRAVIGVGKAVDIFLTRSQGLHFITVGNNTAIGIGDELEQAALGTYVKKFARSILAEADDDIVTSAAHGFESGLAITFPVLNGGTGLTAITQVYYVRDVTPNTFKVALTPGGAAVNITADATSGSTALPVAVAGLAWEAAPSSSSGGQIRALLFADPQLNPQVPITLESVSAAMLAAVLDLSGKTVTLGAAPRKRPTLVDANGATLTAALSGGVISNAGAVGEATFVLPAATPGLEFNFLVEAAQELRIDPAGTETVALLNGAQQAAGLYITANAVGEAIRIACLTAGTWSCLGGNGTWTVES